MHGLSLIIFTVLVFGGLFYLSSREIPLSCRCADGALIQGTRGGLEIARRHCEAVCKPHGGLPSSRP